MTIGERMKQRRKETGVPVGEVAKAMGVSVASVYRYEKGDIEKLPGNVLEALSTVLCTTPAYLMGWEKNEDLTALPSNAIPFAENHMVPIVGTIPAGYPTLAFEEIEGYASIPYKDKENYFFLRVQGDSMTGAGIQTNDLVLIRKQAYAENGQIVAARVNGDEATLKRFTKQGDTVLLLPENPSYEPKIVSSKDFDLGEAQIIGVAVEVRHMLQ